MSIRIQAEPFDIGHEISQLSAADARVGAIASFMGLVRDMGGADPLISLTLEHYPGMTEKALASLESEARARWDVLEVLIVHRVGRLQPQDPIVLVVVTGGHRAETFSACEYLMDALKTRAPFWKKESTASGDHWVEPRLSDDKALERWK
jgi:molybdopterin synthase catalytic subunit